ncbi:PQQ-dependent sugar dehydrogenase [Sutcliffiella rhizosphaerae]|uniref:Glucose/Sorbosone dehydrogenase domain-containing protein n=1 Tax=Sutcliffiella rhizosphaerae TaxID=2880967 RepID=A0ABN8AEX0_9BACI|nr:PQQ-dependent sugar dehydrogenase [Sutcliffiella rhizosphaerae]CAG9621683.1 hypothetical protein BACCIP111883_02456 [Sutcliffiella rhizosphaerae]
MFNKNILLLLVIIFIGGCTNQETQPESNNETETSAQLEVNDQLESEVLAIELQIPWSIAKAGETIFISERQGTIVKVEEDGTETRNDVQVNEPVLAYGEGGFLGLALHPDFNNTKLAFAYHTYGTEQNVRNRIIQIRYNEEDGWKEENVLLDDIPGAIHHNGGRLMVGPDNKLYATVGDVNVPESAQDQDSLSGSILRLNLDGTVPEDNPFSNSYVYSYGHRNPQGIAWEPETKVMYASEHGPSAHDEINIIEPGKNYGWPVIIGDEEAEGMEVPLFHSYEQTWAPSGMVFNNEKLYVANLRGEAIRGFDLTDMEESIFWEGNGRIRDIFLDGNQLYFVTNNTDGRGNPSPDDDQLILVTID